jgi:hypothetical protein
MDVKVTNTTLALLDQWKTLKGIQSDNAAAIELGLTRAAVSAWRAMRTHASVTIADRMASDLRLDVIQVLAAIEADRATRPDEQAVWRRYGKAAFMTLLVGFALPGSLPGKLQAATALPNQGVQIEPISPIMRSDFSGVSCPHQI